MDCVWSWEVISAHARRSHLRLQSSRKYPPRSHSKGIPRRNLALGVSASQVILPRSALGWKGKVMRAEHFVPHVRRALRYDVWQREERSFLPVIRLSVAKKSFFENLSRKRRTRHSHTASSGSVERDLLLQPPRPVTGCL